jgi:diguanylate cyclase (GGDEF)-like protein/PAS domain S-box-containing protein
MGVLELGSVWRSGGVEMFDWALVEVVICSAVLYMAIAGRRSVAGWVGTFGFVMWGMFYAVGTLLPHTSAVVKLVYVCWTLPKYFVAFSMILKTFEDAAEEKTRLAEDYRLLYEDFRMMFEGHPNPMWVYAAEDGRVLSANESAVRRYGYSAEEFERMRVTDLEVTSEEDAKLIEALFSDSSGAVVRHQFKDGRRIWASLMQSGIKFRGMEACFQIARDVTDRVEHMQVRMHQANHDVLTGLPNRALFADRIQQCMKRCEREDRKATLLTIDVDHFKAINDTYGHAVGDECLKIVAARLSSKIRQVDTIARVGGEEFAAIIGGLHIAEDAEKVAESLLRVFDEPLWLGELEMAVTVSIGIAIYPDDAVEAETLARRSDEALYAAKRAGRNRAVASASLGVERVVVKQLGAA